MKAFRGAAFAAALVLTLLSPPFLTLAYAGEGPGNLPAAPEPPKLRWKCGEFDPAREAPRIPSGLAIDESQGVYVVQFDGPVLTEESGRLQQYAEILAYIPDYAYAVRADPSYTDEIRAMGHVRYVGLFEPGYKIDPQLSLGETPRQLSIVCFRTGDVPKAARDIEALGATISSVDPLRIRAEAPGSRAIRISFLPEVQWIEEYHPPQVDNGNAARIIKVRSATDGAYNWGTSSLWSYNPSTGKYEGWTGANFTAAVADTGVDGTHPAFNGKKVAYFAYGYTAWTDYTSYAHGTHTSGTVLGNGAWRTTDPGTYGRYAGMAPGAGLVGQMIAGWCTIYDLCHDAVASGASVSSNSWGGGSPGAYDGTAAEYDSLVRDADAGRAGNQSLTICFSAGNSGPGDGTIDPPASGKNVIAVGAIDDSSGAQVADFSSRGPCVDGRIKPDVVAPGVSVMSCHGNSQGSYQTMSGTSMSCPVVAGASLIVYQYYNATRGAIPSPAMVKNLLINGADAMTGYAYPGRAQGWGRLDLPRSLLNTTTRRIWTGDQGLLLSTGTGSSYLFNVTTSAELKISLVWTDVNGTVNVNPALVNDLDLRVTAPNGTTYYGNQFNGSYSVANGSADRRNNVEVFRLAAPVPGQWRANVRGNNVPLGPQDYSLVIGGAIDNVTVKSIDLGAEQLDAVPEDPAEGETVTFTGNIVNLGDLPESAVRYRFKVTGPDKSVKTIGDDAVGGLPAKGSIPVSANWTAVRGAYTASLEANPDRYIAEDRDDNNIVTLALKVRGYGLELTAPNLTVYVDPGRKSDFEVEVHNRANTNDNFTLALVSVLPAGWNGSLENDSLQLPEGVNRSFRVFVTAPAGALAGDVEYLTVRATSQGNRTYTDTITIKAIVNQTYGLNLTSSAADLWLLPGVVTTVVLKAGNSGNGRDSAQLDISGAPSGWQAYLSQSRFVLPAGWTENVTLTLAPPSNAPALFSAVVTVGASYDGGRTVSLPITVHVRQVARLELELADGPGTEDAGGNASYVLRVRNLGNGADPFNMTAALPDGWTGEFENVLPVKPGDFTLVDLKLSIPRNALSGEVRFSLTATSGINRTVSSELGLELSVNQVYGVDLSAAETRALVESGNSTEFEVQVNNTGNGEDLIQLSAEDSLVKGWRIAFYPAQVDLPAYGSTTVMVKVRPPANATEGGYFFTARAASAGDSTKAASVRFRIDLSVPPPPPIQPPVNNTPPPTYTGPPPSAPPNAVTAWLKGHWYLPVALLAIIIMAVAAVAVSRSRRRRRLLEETQAEQPAEAPEGYDGYEPALISTEAPAEGAASWEAPAVAAPVPWIEDEASVLDIPEVEIETIDMSPPPARPRARTAYPPHSATPARRPAPPASAGISPRKDVETDIDDILARIAEISKK